MKFHLAILIVVLLINCVTLASAQCEYYRDRYSCEMNGYCEWYVSYDPNYGYTGYCMDVYREVNRKTN